MNEALWKSQNQTDESTSGRELPRDAVASLFKRLANYLHRLAQEGVDVDASMTAEVENYGKVLPHFDNHHNAMLCPYCNREPLVARLTAAEAELRAVRFEREHQNTITNSPQDGRRQAEGPGETVDGYLELRETPAQ